LSTSGRRFGFEDGAEVACGDDRGPILAIDKSAETGMAGAALEDASWMDDEFVICADDDVGVWFDRDSGDRNGNGDEARLLTVKYLKTRCRRLG
jgi:hypothetical protein